MCGGGGWVPSLPDLGASVVQTVQDIPASINTATREVASNVKDQATLQNLSYVAPYTLLASGSGREQLAQTFQPLISPVANIVAPGSGSMVTNLANGVAGYNPNPPSDGGWGSLFSLRAPGSAAPLSQGAGPQPGAYAPAVGGNSWLIIAGIGAAVVAVLVLMLRRK